MKYFLIICISLSLVFFTHAEKSNKTEVKTEKKQSSTPKKTQTRHIITSKPKVEKEPKKEVSVIMRDPKMEEKWDLEVIKAKKAWLKFSTGSKDIVVAVIDTGIDINHPDLKDNIWKNPKEIPNNNIDDDNNGFVDDVHGWNFVPNKNNLPNKNELKGDPTRACNSAKEEKDTGNNEVKDDHGHGTHIAGIIGAVGGNGIGISGVAPKVSLMALKYYSPNGTNNLCNTVRAIHYAIDNGAHIINYSGGGLESNPDEKEAIARAEKKGILVVAAAGNEASNMDKKQYYPASYSFSNILSVTATNVADTVLKSSNFGKTVHESAPGRDILSTLPGGTYGVMTGTSQATAVATGAAVLVMDYYKNKTARFAIKQLKMTGDLKDNLDGKTSQSRRLNIFKAIQARGFNLTFMDEHVDTGEDREPFKKETDEIEMITQALTDPNNPTSANKQDPYHRDISTTDEKKDPEQVFSQKQEVKKTYSQKKKPFFKRWFFKLFKKNK